MRFRNRSNMILGTLLILLGVYLLARQFYPGLPLWGNISLSWPWYVIAIGVFLLCLGLLFAAPGMVVPASIVTGIGGILYYQNLTGQWDSWRFLWTLIPGFVGVGTLLAELWRGNVRKAIHDGLPLIIFSLLLFAVFGSLVGGLGYLVSYWPVLLILIGGWMVFQPLLRKQVART